MKQLIAAALFVATMTNSSIACNIADIEMKSLKMRTANDCRATDCSIIKGAGVLRNNCNKPIGVQLKIVGYDKNKLPIAVRDMWPASTRNIKPGDFAFSIDQWLDYDPSIKSITVEPISVKEWH